MTHMYEAGKCSAWCLPDAAVPDCMATRCLRGRYLVVDNFVTREVAARVRADAHTLQRQGAPASCFTAPTCQ